jgi:hypothetical protein
LPLIDGLGDFCGATFGSAVIAPVVTVSGAPGVRDADAKSMSDPIAVTTTATSRRNICDCFGLAPFAPGTAILAAGTATEDG